MTFANHYKVPFLKAVPINDLLHLCSFYRGYLQFSIAGLPLVRASQLIGKMYGVRGFEIINVLKLPSNSIMNGFVTSIQQIPT